MLVSDDDVDSVAEDSQAAASGESGSQAGQVLLERHASDTIQFGQTEYIRNCNLSIPLFHPISRLQTTLRHELFLKC